MTSLKILAAGLTSSDLAGSGDLCVVAAVDGKQRHIYLARYRLGDSGGGVGSLEMTCEVEERVLELVFSEDSRDYRSDPRAELLKILAPGAVVVGDAAELVLDTTGASRPMGITRGPPACDWPRAAVLAELASRTAAGELPRFEPEAVHGLVPKYLRPSEAERKFGLPR